MLKELSSYIYEIAVDYIELSASELSIEIDEEPANDLLTITISNNIEWAGGAPSRNPPPCVPMLRQVCGLCGGRFTSAHSQSGSKLTALMQYGHADRPPMGGVPCLIQGLIMSWPETNISYTHRYNGREYKLSTMQIKSMLDGVPFDTPSLGQWVRENIADGLTQILQPEVAQ